MRAYRHVRAIVRSCVHGVLTHLVVQIAACTAHAEEMHSHFPHIIVRLLLVKDNVESADALEHIDHLAAKRRQIPPLELPLGPLHKNRHNALPVVLLHRLCRVDNLVVIRVQAVMALFSVNDAHAIFGSVASLLLLLARAIHAIFEKLLNVPLGNHRRRGLRHNNDGLQVERGLANLGFVSLAILFRRVAGACGGLVPPWLYQND